jgi:hypothetical protein|tara:strand:+ start:277 stop:879 length:603 start_codon:yes stop_codon:yes gene_type:complete
MQLIHVSEPEHNILLNMKKAASILHHKPDIVMFENPPSFLSDLNNFEPGNKPEAIIKEWLDLTLRSADRYPWLKTEVKVIKAIMRLWESGNQVLLFEIDGPFDLTGLEIGEDGIMNRVWNFLRAICMKNNIQKIEETYPKSKAIIFLHNLHWKNILFLREKPAKGAIFQYFFREYRDPQQVEILISNEVLLKYWKKESGF